jgi:hypothetical protein
MDLHALEMVVRVVLLGIDGYCEGLDSPQVQPGLLLGVPPAACRAALAELQSKSTVARTANPQTVKLPRGALYRDDMAG